MPLPRRCCISDNEFRGFEIIIDLDYYDSLEEIVGYVKYHLINSLTKLKLESLVKKANEKKFHIHDIEMGNLLMSNEKSTIWICGHC